MWTKIKKWWWFTLNNPVIRTGEHGGFKWKFRRFWLDVETLSGNMKMRFTAAEHPYGYLISGTDDDNIQGFAEVMYSVAMLLTTEQQFANEIQQAVENYGKRLEEKEKPVEDKEEEHIAIEEVKAIKEAVEKPKKKTTKKAKK